MEKNHTLATIDPKSPDFTFWLTLAHRWCNDRPKFYPHTGGFSLLFAYLDAARQWNRKQIGVFKDGAMLSLVTVEFEGDGVFHIHVTSPKHADTKAIRCAVNEIGGILFERLNAEYLYVTCPTVNGHIHKGSKALAEFCGMMPEGLSYTETIGSTSYTWQRYSVRKENYGRNRNQSTI